jgi:hypothetical protein
MALRNAFDNLATESSLRRLANLLTFARDSADRIRVVVDGGTIGGTVQSNIFNVASTASPTGGNSSPYYSSVSWNSVDARESLRLSHTQRSDFVKRNRWTF